MAPSSEDSLMLNTTVASSMMGMEKEKSPDGFRDLDSSYDITPLKITTKQGNYEVSEALGLILWTWISHSHRRRWWKSRRVQITSLV
jgi:hypothetical protein